MTETRPFLLVCFCAVAALASPVSGCSDEGAVLRPIIDVPPPGSAAYPYDGVDTFSLATARAGDGQTLREVSLVAGQELVLPETPFGEDLVVHMKGLAGGVEFAYGRTCAIDIPDGRIVVEPHLYLSRIVRWGPGGQPNDGLRTGGNAYALPDGRAVFTGGDPDGRTAELFDPISARYTRLAAQLTPRQGAALAALPDGRAVLVGGRDTTQNLAEVIEVVDPLRAPVRQLITLPGPALIEHAVTTLVSGDVLVTGGLHAAMSGQAATVTASAWLVSPGADVVLEPPDLLPVAMNQARAGHTMTRLGDDLGADILIIGGRDDLDQPVASSELYRPLREAFELVATADLSRPRWGHAAVRMPGGFILVLGGLAPGATGVEPVAEMELYDPGQNRFTPAGTLPASAGLTEETVTPLPDGRVLIAGGRDATGQPVTATFVARLDPVDGQVDVVPADSMAVARAGHSAVRLCDGTILIVGGSDDPAGVQAERYNPASIGRE